MVSDDVESNAKQQVESVLFSASKPISVKEIKEITGLSSQKISSTLKQLRKEYADERKTAMDVIKIGSKYVMQLKSNYHNQSMMIAEPAIDEAILKTLALIAFHQPIKQSNLRRMAGEKIYEHVDFLSDLQLIHTKKHGATEMITLTKHFPEYFGIEATTPEEIRSFLMKKVAKDTIKHQSY
jgi:segregation and condensation protein B